MKRRGAKRGGLLLPVLAGLACATPSPPPARATPLPVELALRPVVGALRALEVTISGSAHDFLFDTGGALTLLTPRLAAALGCQPWGRLSLFRAGGQRLDLQRCGDLSLQLGALPLTAPSAILDLAPQLPQGAPELGGLLSLQSFGPHTVTLDLAGERLVVESEASLAARRAELRPLEARLERQAGGVGLDLFLAVGTARGPLWFEVDSANLDRVLLAPHALALLGLDPTTPEGAELEVSLDLPGLGRLERPARVRAGLYDGVLDAATLRELVLSVDLVRGRAWGRKRTSE